MWNNIALFCCRTGSKRVPNKNFRRFKGKPIIYHPIEVACNFFKKVVVSTENENIGKAIAYKFKKVNFLQRSKKNAGDDVGLYEVVMEVLNELEIKRGKVCLIYPTAVFLKPEQLKQACRMLKKYDTVFPVQEDLNQQEKTLKVFGDSASYKYPQYNLVPTQACKTSYHHIGSFFYCDIEALIKNKTIIGENCGAIPVRWNEGQDVDTQADWEMMEAKYNWSKK